MGVLVGETDRETVRNARDFFKHDFPRIRIMFNGICPENVSIPVGRIAFKANKAAWIKYVMLATNAATAELKEPFRTITQACMTGKCNYDQMAILGLKKTAFYRKKNEALLEFAYFFDSLTPQLYPQE